MTRDEMKQILMRIDVSFPNWKPKDIGFLIDVWMEELGEYDYKTVLLAVKSYINADSTGFAPSIGQIINKINSIKAQMNGDDINEMQAWSLVSVALRDSVYHSKERFMELPKVVQKSVGSPENLRAWALDENFNENVAQSHFISTFRSVKERERQFDAMPTEVKNLISMANQKMLGDKGNVSN